MYGLTIGKRRQGKSTLSLAVALSQSKTVVIYDPNAQFRQWGVVAIAALPDFLEHTDEVDISAPFVAVVRPESPYDDFGGLADTLWGWEDFTLIVDEAHELQSPHDIHPGLARLLRRGPASVHVLQTSHRLQDFHRLSRHQSGDIFIFRIGQSDDIKSIAREYDDRLTEIIPKLGIYEVAHRWVDIGGVDRLSVWRDPAAWFIELGHGEREQFTGGEHHVHGDEVASGNDWQTDHSKA